ncbi:MAG: glycosyl transferase family 1 [Peptococcaceae bacterium BICA1-7]|nr:MAG: glycosyl transferase family 1 [Peptococcaceae bacterium BICA1-7]HBV96279.1 glycosyltransferase family 1 protein [Desulfotomaculum sp.]
MRDLAGRDIICIGPVDWEPIWNRSQQLMSRLPHSNRILYIEPPATLLSAFKDRSLWFKWRLWARGARKKTENIYLYSPPVVLPFGYMYPWVNRINQRWILLFTGMIARSLGFKNPIVWTYLPNTLSLAEGLNPSVLVYDCVDEHSEFPGLISRDAVLEMEKELLGRSDLVFATARGLYEAKKKFASNIYLLPNAADVVHFALAEREETAVPGEIGRLPHPLLGFIGVIHHWIDLDLIEHIARSRPGWTIAMIGPVGPGIQVDRLNSLPNVHFLGRKSKEELPGYLKAFDVCLNPFRKNVLTDRVSPLKVYEYLASGRPVVSVDMPGVQEFKEIIEIAGDYEGFLEAVERVIATDSPEKKKVRLEVAASHSWESRADFIADKIAELEETEDRRQKTEENT